MWINIEKFQNQQVYNLTKDFPFQGIYTNLTASPIPSTHTTKTMNFWKT